MLFYFVAWRGPAKRRKEHQQLIGALSKGDEVVTAGGLVGQITNLDEDWVMINIAKNVEVRLQKGSVVASMPKGTLKAIDG